MAFKQPSLLIMLLIFTPNVFAAEPPDLELLEFLGSFETGDGEWIDPLELTELSDKDLPGNDPQAAPDESAGSTEVYP